MTHTVHTGARIYLELNSGLWVKPLIQETRYNEENLYTALVDKLP